MKKASLEILLVFSITLFIGCNGSLDKDKSQRKKIADDSKFIELPLLDSLGLISFNIPLRYDTNFSWIYRSDCGKPCESQMYRFQSKELPITKESGWLWLGEPKDTVDRFTISHSKYIIFYDGDTAKNIIRHNHIKEELASNSANPKIVFDTIQKINDRYFSIIQMENTDSIYSKKVLAVTTIKNNQIKFQCELLTKKNDSIAKNFFTNSMDIIKSIQIKKGI